MKNLIAIPVAVFAGALAGSLVVSLWQPSPERNRETRPAEREARPDTELLARIDELRDTNQELRQRLAALELRPGPTAREPAGDFVASERFAAFEQEVRGWMIGQPAAVEGATELAEIPELREEVAAALKTIRKDEAVAGAIKKNEGESGRLEERVSQVSEWLSLDDYQAGEVRTILVAKDEQDRELIRLWEAGTDDEILGETKRSNALALHDGLERVLSAEQLGTFRSKFPRPAER